MSNPSLSSPHALPPAAPAPTPPGLIGCYKATRDLAGADLLTFASLTPGVVRDLFAVAGRLKQEFRDARASRGLPIPGDAGGVGHATSIMELKPLAGTTAVLLFEKPSLRTKMSFEAGISMLGGSSIFMDHSQQKLGEREAVKDYALNLERWVSCIIARVYSQEVLYELAQHASVPVINALSDRFHPCQALADLFTLSERAAALGVPLTQMKLAYVGDGNNVCHSLMHAATMLGVHTTVISPTGYEPAPDVIAECQTLCQASGATLTITDDLAQVKGHHAVYTDVWVSMGQADTAAKRRKVFADYQVNAVLMALASKGLNMPEGSYFMHCLPAQRGVEVTDEVIDSKASLVYEQAENRMHAQDALLVAMLGRA
ncbi:MAG: ornithine carbamoyltransferase [Tepidisphaera sp.]|nr:ornithine carbamoyltransferase [Tepidisphaera sp.]